jgi:hypothetical protein
VAYSSAIHTLVHTLMLSHFFLCHNSTHKKKKHCLGAAHAAVATPLAPPPLSDWATWPARTSASSIRTSTSIIFIFSVMSAITCPCCEACGSRVRLTACPPTCIPHSTHHCQCHCEAVHSIGPQQHLMSNCHRSVHFFYHASLARRIYHVQHQLACAATRRCDPDCVSCFTAQPPCTHSCVHRAAVTAGTRRSLATPPTLTPTIASWGRPRGGGAAEDGPTC